MTNNHALVRNHVGVPDPEDWRTLLEMADVLVKSGLLPEGIKTPQAAVVVMQKGRELGIPPLYAISNIVVLKGKPAASAELLLAIIYRDHGDDAIRFTESNAQKCTISYKRRSWPDRQDCTFSIQDAQTAQLAGGNTWKQYPAAMLRARCISAVARMGFPDSIGGMYTPEELNATVTVNAQGDIEIESLPADYLSERREQSPPADIVTTASMIDPDLAAENTAALNAAGGPVNATPPPQPHAQVYICDYCTLPIEKTEHAGVTYSPSQIAVATKKSHGQTLHLNCRGSVPHMADAR